MILQMKPLATLPALDPTDFAKYRTLSSEVAQALRKAYEEKRPSNPHLTQEYLGQCLGISKSAVNHLLSGRTAMGLMQARVLAELLGEDFRALTRSIEDQEAIDAVSHSALPAGSVDLGVVKRTWTAAREQFDTATPDDWFQIATGTAQLLSADDSLTDAEVAAKVRQYVFEQRGKN
jgi:transcriptional regulator with XRE-family HTH domain